MADTHDVIITGGLGFVGSLVASKLLELGQLTDSFGKARALGRLFLLDAVPPTDLPLPLQRWDNDTRLAPRYNFNIADAAAVKAAFEEAKSAGALTVFHLASVMSGEGEANFDKCLNVNVDGIRNLLDSARSFSEAGSRAPAKFIFSSTLAVFGPEDAVTDHTKQVPLNTYGMTKVIAELLVNDYSRRGFIDGRTARLPTVIVRPGKPNAASTSVYSGVVREPLNGEPCITPIELDQPHPVVPFRSVMEALVALHEVPADRLSAALKTDRAVNLAAVTMTLRELREATVKVAAELGLPKNGAALGELREEIDPRLNELVRGMPRSVDASRAIELGIVSATPPTAADIVRHYVEAFL